MAALVTLTLASGSGAPSGTVNLTLSIASTGGAAPTAVQWTFSLTADVSLVSVALGAAGIAASKTLNRSGSLCIVSAVNTNVIPDGVLANFTLQVAASPSTSSIPLALVSMVASDAAGLSITIAGVSSTLTVLAPTVSCPVSGGTATVGIAYSAQIVASGGTPPYTFSVS